MTLTVYTDLTQRSDEWYAARRGIVTASAVGQLISQRSITAIDVDCISCLAVPNEACKSIRSGTPMKTLHTERADTARNSDAPPIVQVAANEESRRLTLLLAAERITGWTEATYVSDDMWRGIDDEPFARNAYSEHIAPVVEAGFMVEDTWGFPIGYSPDGLVGDDGLIEIKSRRPKAHVATILADEPPIESMAQLQCGLLVSGRQWIDYVSYCGGMPLWRTRIEPDEEWMSAIVSAVEALEENVAEMTHTYSAAIAGLPMTERNLIQDMVI